jgi:hypothetical protein
VISGDPVHCHEADVVTVPGVFVAGISEAHNQFHGKNSDRSVKLVCHALNFEKIPVAMQGPSATEAWPENRNGAAGAPFRIR